MASKSTNSSVSVRTCESVAQKLFIQCRDSGSTYKSLTGSLRTLRNVLGEVDEALDDNVGQQDDPNLPCALSKCEAILLKLEAALVLSRCSSQCELNSNTINSSVIDLDVANRELVAAYNKMTRTEATSLAMRPDTLPVLRNESQNSKTSSTCSVMNRNSPSHTCSPGSAAPSTNGIKRQSRSTTEKEVFYPEKQIYHHYHPDRANRLQRSSSQASLQSKGCSNARPDPYLASQLEAACGLIHHDDTLVGQTTEHEPSWIPSAELQGDGRSPTTVKEQPSTVDAMDLSASHGRKDSLLGHVDMDLSQRTSLAGEHSKTSQTESLDRGGRSSSSLAKERNSDKSEDTLECLAATAVTYATSASTNGDCISGSSNSTAPPAMPTGSSQAQAAYPPRPPPPTPANTQVGSQHLVHTAPLPGLPEDIAQATALPVSDSEDDLYCSTPVMKPAVGTTDDELAVPPPLTLKQTISKVDIANSSATESGPDSVTTSADSVSEGFASAAEEVSHVEHEDDAPEMVQVKKRQVPMKSNSVANIKQTIAPRRDDKEIWLSSRGASRYHAAKRAPSAPPAVTFQPTMERYPISRNEHHHAICDVCDQKIFGRRHKCLDCADWDHSDECVDKARPMNPEHHRFVTLDQPVTPWPEDALDATADEYLRSLPDNHSKGKLVRKNRSAQPSANGTSTPLSRKPAPASQPPVAYAESPDFVGDVHHRTFYGPGGIDEATPTELLDDERVKLIVHFFNNCDWERAEKFLIGHLDSLAARSVDTSAVRRVQHLLAVCASLRGEWDEAIDRLLRVLKTPLKQVADIDDGDCAAAYWLGDLYAMQNRRAEALLAYSIAERSSLFNRSDPSFRRAITTEQSAVQIGVSKAEFKHYWSLEGESADPTSILNKEVVTMQTAKQILASPSVAFDDASLSNEGVLSHRRHSSSSASSQLSQDRPRASYLSNLDHGAPRSNIWDSDLMKITHWSFQPNSAWPMPFDPVISLANIERGRLYAYECDMLSVFSNNPEAKLPRPSLLSLNKLSNCFTHLDLKWLITTLRTHLTLTSIPFSEIVNIHGTYFCCRYAVTHTLPNHSKIVATTNYFTIALFQHPLPGKGYGVEIVSGEGMSSARIARVDGEWVKGAHVAEAKRMRSLIRAGLEEAAMRERVGEKGSNEKRDGDAEMVRVGEERGKQWWREGWVCK